MKTKEPFTKFQTALKKICKEKNMSPVQAFCFFQDRLKQMVIEGRTKKEFAAQLVESVELDCSILNGDCIHFFLPGNGFFDWVASCEKVDIKEIAGDRLMAIQSLTERKNSCVFHFPCSEKRCSFAFYISEYIDGGNKILIHDSSNSPLSKTKHIEYVGELERVEDADNDLKARFLSGLGMYINCFPETLKDGVPEDLKHPAYHNYPISKTIGISEKVKAETGTHASPCGHFRSGHFRILRSEKFKNKRFQAIFIAQTFVKGKAMTVLSPEEITLDSDAKPNSLETSCKS